MKRSPTSDRMNRRPSPTHLERGRENVAAINEQHERDREAARLWEQTMTKRDQSAMGFARTDTSRAQAALDGWGELNAALDEAVDEIEKAMGRERLAANAGRLDRGDLGRAPALRNGGAR